MRVNMCTVSNVKCIRYFPWALWLTFTNTVQHCNYTIHGTPSWLIHDVDKTPMAKTKCENNNIILLFSYSYINHALLILTAWVSSVTNWDCNTIYLHFICCNLALASSPGLDSSTQKERISIYWFYIGVQIHTCPPSPNNPYNLICIPLGQKAERNPGLVQHC